MILSTASFSRGTETYPYLPVGVTVTEDLSVDGEWRPARVQSVLDKLSHASCHACGVEWSTQVSEARVGSSWAYICLVNWSKSTIRVFPLKLQERIRFA